MDGCNAKGGVRGAVRRPSETPCQHGEGARGRQALGCGDGEDPWHHKAMPVSHHLLPFTCPRQAQPGRAKLCLGTTLRCLN